MVFDNQEGEALWAASFNRLRSAETIDALIGVATVQQKAFEIEKKEKGGGITLIMIENVEVFGWEAAIRGMRNPMNSWEKSDSYPAVDCGKCGKIEREGTCKKEDRNCSGYECFVIGPNDNDLMMRLAKSGTEHRKYMRMIHVQLDVTAPTFWLIEADTYKVGTVRNSCSKMHKIHAFEITPKDFSNNAILAAGAETANVFYTVVAELERLRNLFNETNNIVYWKALLQLLPHGYNVRSTIDLNYEVLANMYRQRKNHKLDEWREFCTWIETLPYSELITGGGSE